MAPRAMSGQARRAYFARLAQPLDFLSRGGRRPGRLRLAELWPAADALPGMAHAEHAAIELNVLPADPEW